MNKLFKALAITAMALSLPVTASQTDWVITDEVNEFTDQLNSKAYTRDSDDRTVFIYCYKGEVKLSVGSAAKNYNINIYAAQVRVDKNKVFTTDAIGAEGTIHYLRYPDEYIDQFKAGKKAIFKTEGYNSDAVSKFSLIGFADAYDHVNSNCKG